MKEQACQTEPAARDSFFEEQQFSYMSNRRYTTSMLSLKGDSRNATVILGGGGDQKYNSCIQEPERKYKKKSLQLKLKKIATI